MWGRAGHPSSASPARAPAPSWRGSRRRCGWWPLRSWSSQSLSWIKAQTAPTWPGRWLSEIWWGQEEGLLSPMLAAGLPSSIHSQPFLWKEKSFRNQVDSTSQNLHKSFSQSYQNVPQLLCIVECDSIVLEQGFQFSKDCIILWKTHLKSFVCVRIFLLLI